MLLLHMFIRTKFSFVQVLRAAFTDVESSYVMVGAAITVHSTPEIELQETCAKLGGIKVFEKNTIDTQNNAEVV